MARPPSVSRTCRIEGGRRGADVPLPPLSPSWLRPNLSMTWVFGPGNGTVLPVPLVGGVVDESFPFDSASPHQRPPCPGGRGVVEEGVVYCVPERCWHAPPPQRPGPTLYCISSVGSTTITYRA